MKRTHLISQFDLASLSGGESTSEFSAHHIKEQAFSIYEYLKY